MPKALRPRRAQSGIRRFFGWRLLLLVAIAGVLLARGLNTFGGANGSYPVVSVVDGDTIKVRMSGRVESVRLIGIDAPETNAPGRPVQCFGPEASAKAKELLAGKAVRLEYDESQDRRDRYDRLLAYAWVDDVLYNEWVIRHGYAREFTYRAPYRYQANFHAAQAEARAAGRGLWAAETCGGKL